MGGVVSGTTEDPPVPRLCGRPPRYSASVSCISEITSLTKLSTEVLFLLCLVFAHLLISHSNPAYWLAAACSFAACSENRKKVWMVERTVIVKLSMITSTGHAPPTCCPRVAKAAVPDTAAKMVIGKPKNIDMRFNTFVRR